MKKLSSNKLLPEIYTTLLNHFGFCNWWPGDSRLEIVCGALLTQNTNWQNVEKALQKLKDHNLLSLESLLSLPEDDLGDYIRSSGYYRQKANRLKILLSFLVETYHWDGRSAIATSPDKFRSQLLGLHGIGRETADSILLYAFDYSFFVVDAYTKRFLSRLPHNNCHDYEAIRSMFEETLKDDFENNLSNYKDFHAQIVYLGKYFCRPKPLCENCPLNTSNLCSCNI